MVGQNLGFFHKMFPNEHFGQTNTFLFFKRSGVGNGNPLQYSCLENSMDRVAWWASVLGVAESLTCLSTHARSFLKNQEYSYDVFNEDRVDAVFIVNIGHLVPITGDASLCCKTLGTGELNAKDNFHLFCKTQGHP